MAVLLLAAGAMWVLEEARTSRWQSEWLSEIAGEARFEVAAGPSDAVRFPVAGPFDHRLGYDRLPQWTQRLQSEGFAVAAQARMSPRMLELVDRGLFAPYREKTQAGLRLQACRGETLYASHHPQRVYAGFDRVPRLLVDMLVFIENRGLFAPEPALNPAVDWARLARAAFDQAVHRVFPSHEAAGGSTLATQIEKYRHSPGGRTATARDKLEQMASASVRSYLDGPDTRGSRRRIVVDYLNSVPLSATGSYGEVIGFGEAIWAWYGRDFEHLNALLRKASEPGSSPTPAQAMALKEALSLLVAQRRPSHYLSEAGLASLRELTDFHLRLLVDAGILGAAMRDLALPLPLQLRRKPFVEPAPAFAEAKASTALRTRLLGLLDLPGAYDLDRLDLGVRSSFAADAQRQAGAVLRSLATREGAARAGLIGPSALRAGDDPARIAYSFTLFESNGATNLLRIQTDNLDRPFDLNEGARLDLGSTSKLRTLVTYLEQVAALHARWGGLPGRELAAVRVRDDDAIGRWARGHLARASDRSLPAMLEAAMDRQYSASTTETFFTGGGEHRFGNFEARDEGRTMSLREALSRSVNLPFIRLMRDIVRHIIATSPHIDPTVLDSADDPRRQVYLARFADDEGSQFMARFWRKYQALSPADAEAALVAEARRARVPLANAFFMLEPQGSVQDLQRFLAKWLPGAADEAARLHEAQGPGRWNLQDRGYLAGVHPLELWVAGHVRRQPGASLAATLAAGAQQRQEAYAWLFRSRNKAGQDRRIRQQIEEQAFREVHAAWQRLGYPFAALTPSYAAALGASGDRPAALAELAGIIANRGLRLPVTRLQNLDFAVGTPYETRFVRAPAPPERVLDAAVAETAWRAMRAVVEEGTGRRLQGMLRAADGSVIPIAGKTGTGDHRFDVYGAGGRLVSSRVVNRSATLVFVIGERHFGTVMAYVHEPYAADYRFTSALPSQILKALAPVLAPLVRAPGCGEPGRREGGA
ncbi:MAG: transglycosylase domain-containing protein [Ramlibacter sp.]